MIKNNFLKFIYYFILNIFFLVTFLFKRKLKIALCTMGKRENLYVKEFVNYYKKLGIDKIFIYDDNDINTEKISDTVNFKINSTLEIR